MSIEDQVWVLLTSAAVCEDDSQVQVVADWMREDCSNYFRHTQAQRAFLLQLHAQQQQQQQHQHATQQQQQQHTQRALSISTTAGGSEAASPQRAGVRALPASLRARLSVTGAVAGAVAGSCGLAAQTSASLSAGRFGAAARS
eukprot:gnl/Hemi2/5949_TR2069_c2_g1_i1.p3 gnl/Hemi2/5949_TR2069_c2_g1~~gnl/Hemi2/5949_TR2069_c2_g1_i1.p3  ORF type:complete len:143 (+),score=60.18 gnl/Hemi2/5949_TR2069_c2_g1_i1:83-511(+)